MGNNFSSFSRSDLESATAFDVGPYVGRIGHDYKIYQTLIVIKYRPHLGPPQRWAHLYIYVYIGGPDVGNCFNIQYCNRLILVETQN
jgi:hypothetical protein